MEHMSDCDSTRTRTDSPRTEINFRAASFSSSSAYSSSASSPVALPSALCPFCVFWLTTPFFYNCSVQGQDMPLLIPTEPYFSVNEPNSGLTILCISHPSISHTPCDSVSDFCCIHGNKVSPSVLVKTMATWCHLLHSHN